MNPYQNCEEHCFWSHAMTEPAPGQIDPVTKTVIIQPNQKIVTMGSCFAQHLAKHIQKIGLNYYVAENAPENMPYEIAKQYGYGIFSARYGNVYTVRQALQLFDRAFNYFSPQDQVWVKENRFVDAFRPRIEPGGWSTRAEVEQAAYLHLKYVRDVFSLCDWFVFTLGLTEAWRSKIDGAVYPLAPGVAGGKFDQNCYEFINFTIDEVKADLELLINKIRNINPEVKILLTVSPVPLIATYEKRHVLVSTTYSKSVLRVAADEIEKKFNNVIYFPAYEIITSPANGGHYYSDDLRQVTDLGVQHVMRIFSKHFTANNINKITKSIPLIATTLNDETEIVCDEEVINDALRESGFNI